ncbi:MAG: molybdenum cofactor guanylyltransferase [Syntrophomonadaceae bacterium]|jgi:molybdopterin-guanine dinucleotide biosynthesis protein A|nr:molybdenum cofactor guanylyltransferase [Syntrophomonadaceae bacterium]
MPAVAILSGGKSSRMGINKALASLNGIKVIEYILARLKPYFDELLIVTNEPELYEKYPARVITDIFPRKGPIAGIHAALMNTSRTEIFVLSCDMPFVNTDVINYMMERAADYDSVVPVIGGRLQPTAAVYNQSCVPLLTDCLKKDKLKLTRIFDDLNALYLDETDLARFGPVAEVFFNINDLAALDKAREIAGRN